jgi:hypothetical protein
MFAKSPGDVIPRTRKETGVKKKMFTILFPSRKLLIAGYIPKGQKYNQDYFIWDILPELEQEKMRYKRMKQGGTFAYTWITQKVMMVATSKKNSIGKASYAVLIHLILLI